MASRYRSIYKHTSKLFKTTTSSPKPTSLPSLSPRPPTSPTPISRAFGRTGCVQSLLPLHSAVSSARLTSCLGIDSKLSRSLSQGMRAHPGV